ncbi:hypothetical protein GQX73_g305 [Xylaria multiplex]|uniref:Uncharacterized protein n=1 Tax=Xylaria multiplex TaxID=323545 RepID=A0A7C8N196_9PEZI|nr:hypothetical protein GQX73_g305 [Xylaria multiplex]
MDTRKRKHPGEAEESQEHQGKKVTGSKKKKEEQDYISQDIIAPIATTSTHFSHPLGDTHYEQTNCDDGSGDGNEFERRVTELKKRVNGRTIDQLITKAVHFDIFSSIFEDASKEKRKIQDNLKEAQERLRLARIWNEQLTEDMERIGTARQRAPDLDDALENQFMDLRQAVRSFTREFCVDKTSASSLPDYVKSALAKISGITAGKLLQSRLHARYLVEGLIWRILCVQILRNPFVIWGKSPEIANFIWRVQNKSMVTTQRRELWRTMTGQLLNDVTGVNKRRVDAWQEMLVSYVESFANPDHRSSIATEIKAIITTAIELAASLARSRTLCMVQRRHSDASDGVSQNYDSTWMHIIEKSVEHFEDIDFIVTPALVQVTNSAGEKFKSPRVIVKAEVCFGRGRSQKAAEMKIEE